MAHFPAQEDGQSEGGLSARRGMAVRDGMNLYDAINL